ncbi:MAG: helix-turn-helix domain-containing protein, partial [Chloroflexota bacterium]|nr:helix-turn-helix domain-containing protein [Chloroflexota bacterium]
QKGSPPFGDQLRRLRLRAGLSQEALSEQAGLSAAAVGALEQGLRRSPYPHTLMALATALGLSADEQDALAQAAGTREVGRHDAAADAPEARRQTGLPRSLSSFVGRERELAEVKYLLEAESLVTLVGSGGIGKTRLALEVGRGVGEQYADGVQLVELGPLLDSSLVLGAVAAAVGVREQRGVPLRRTLVDALRPRQVLLILDNCEHLIQACAEIAELLLRAGPALRILATSREPLGVPGEVVWSVAPLPQPDAAVPATTRHVLRHAAGRLFVERARSAQPGFTLDAWSAPLVAEICRRLDGIPLALELAATRVRALGVDGLAARLDDRFRLLVGGRTAPARQHTLRATLDWSYDLLGAPERRLLARLAPFAGGWSLPDVEAVCRDQILPVEDVAERLGNLVDQSLVVVEQRVKGVRYRLLETMRQYAAERLIEFGEAEMAHRRHRDHYLDLAERVPASRFDGQHFDWLTEEADNIRAALRWSIDQGEPDAGLRLANANFGRWLVRGPCSEGRAWFDELLAQPGLIAETALVARSLGAAARLAAAQGDLAAAEPLVQRSQTLAERLGDPHTQALVALRRGIIGRSQGDLERARTIQAEALERSRALGDADLQVFNLYSLSTTLLELGECDDAQTLAQECLTLSGRVGHTWGMASAHRTLGRLSAIRGARQEARTHLEESLALSRGLGHAQGIANTLTALAQAAVLEGDEPAARALFWEVLGLARELGDRLEVVHCLEGLGQIEGRLPPMKVARLAGAAAELRAQVGAQLYPRERSAVTDWVEQARQALGEVAFAESFATGRALTLDALVDELLVQDAGKQSGPSADDSVDGLTDREREVAALVGAGLSTRVIAARLVITDGTAKVHVSRILSKLGLHSRAQLAVWVVRRGLIP